MVSGWYYSQCAGLEENQMARQTMKSLRNDVAMLNGVIRDLRERLSAVENRNSELRGRLSDRDAELIQASREAQHLRTRVSELSAALVELRAREEDLKDDLRARLTEVQEAAVSERAATTKMLIEALADK